MLDKQIYLNSFDTSDFYSNKEKYLHKLNSRIRAEKCYMFAVKSLATKVAETGRSASLELPSGEKLSASLADGIIKIKGNKRKRIKYVAVEDVAQLCEEYSQLLSMKQAKAASVKFDRLLPLLSHKVEHNIASKGTDHIRQLRVGGNNKVISTFDSTLTRAIGCEVDELTDEICSLSVFFFDVFKDLLYYGFMWNGDKYIYYTSSAGMIRTKRGIFIKESTYKAIEKKMMCGLSLERINELGGNNVNKHLAYLALTNSATDEWTEFDVDKTIVVDDFEADVIGEVDFIDSDDFSITRKTMPINIPNTDGIGMMLPSVSKKNFMVRAPWVKGLLASFDFRKFILEEGGNRIIKDIYGKEHDVIAEDIQIIFCKSQFKLYKYYSSWDEYKELYKANGCSTGICNVEEDYIKNSKINYQMLQDLFPNEEEIKKITEKSRKKIENVSKNLKTIKEIIGLNRHDDSLSYFQQAIKIYPPLIRDTYTKDTLRDIKNSLLKKYRSGKIEISGKYTFIIPDLYACCEYWFKGEEKPKGILNKGEVSCRLYSYTKELDCLRAPHIYYEHGIRNNIINDKTAEWFNTDALYVSCDDLLSIVLMFDVDGDKALVVADQTFINIAKRSMEGHPPLYYNMKKALPSLINPGTLYKGLTDAFTGGNIGIFANNASKIWNSDVFVNGTKKERETASSYVAIITACENWNIDYAKTLWKPELPKELNDNITEFTKKKLPAFFEFAKDKGKNQIEIRNESFVNKLYTYIPDKKIDLRWLKDNDKVIDNMDYKMLLTHSVGRRKKCPDCVKEKYKELSDKYSYKLNQAMTGMDSSYSYITKLIRDEFNTLGYSEEELTNFLVDYLYGENKRSKGILWICYGRHIINNLKNNLGINSESQKIIQCVDCGEYIEVARTNNRTCRCFSCQQLVDEHNNRERVAKYRAV